MPDFTKPPWIEILGIATLAAVVLAITVPAIQWWVGRRRKEVSYRVLSAEPLVSVREATELGGRLVMTFDGQPIQEGQPFDIRAVVVKVWNSGNEPISDTDFKTPGYLMYGTGAEVLTDGDLRDQPTHADAAASRDPANAGQLLLQPVLLNKRESLTIRALVLS